MSKDYSDFVPYEKANKKERKRRDNEKRRVWEIEPITKVVPDKKKKYEKKKRRRDDYYDEDDYEEWN